MKKEVNIKSLVEKGYNNLKQSDFVNAYMYLNNTDKVKSNCTECFKRSTWQRMVNYTKKLKENN